MIQTVSMDSAIPFSHLMRCAQGHIPTLFIPALPFASIGHVWSVKPALGIAGSNCLAADEDAPVIARPADELLTATRSPVVKPTFGITGSKYLGAELVVAHEVPTEARRGQLAEGLFGLE